MPSKKGTVAYEARNARRQADRWIKSLSKIEADKSGTTLNERAAAHQLITELKKQKGLTYQLTHKPNQKEQDKIKQASAVIRSLASSASMSKGKHGASNLFTQQQINIASRRHERQEDNTSIYTKEEVKVFYRSTQRIWQQPGELVDTHSINKKIMNALGTKSLKEAFDIVISHPQNQKVLEQIRLGKMRKSDMTKEQLELYEKLREKDTSDYDQRYYPSEVFMFDGSTDLRMLTESE